MKSQLPHHELREADDSADLTFALFIFDHDAGSLQLNLSKSLVSDHSIFSFPSISMD